MLDVPLPRIPVCEFGNGTIPFGVTVSENLCAAQTVFIFFRAAGREPARVVE